MWPFEFSVPPPTLLSRTYPACDREWNPPNFPLPFQSFYSGIQEHVQSYSDLINQKKFVTFEEATGQRVLPPLQADSTCSAIRQPPGVENRSLALSPVEPKKIPRYDAKKEKAKVQKIPLPKEEELQPLLDELAETNARLVPDDKNPHGAFWGWSIDKTIYRVPPNRSFARCKPGRIQTHGLTASIFKSGFI